MASDGFEMEVKAEISSEIDEDDVPTPLRVENNNLVKTEERAPLEMDFLDSLSDSVLDASMILDKFQEQTPNAITEAPPKALLNNRNEQLKVKSLTDGNSNVGHCPIPSEDTEMMENFFTIIEIPQYTSVSTQTEPLVQDAAVQTTPSSRNNKPNASNAVGRRFSKRLQMKRRLTTFS